MFFIICSGSRDIFYVTCYINFNRVLRKTSFITFKMYLLLQFSSDLLQNCTQASSLNFVCRVCFVFENSKNFSRFDFLNRKNCEILEISRLKMNISEFYQNNKKQSTPYIGNLVVINHGKLHISFLKIVGEDTFQMNCGNFA